VAVGLDGERAAAVKRRFLDLHRVMSIRDFLSGWFRGAPYEAVRRGNVEDFVAYGFYTRSMSQLPDKVRAACLAARRGSRSGAAAAPPAAWPRSRSRGAFASQEVHAGSWACMTSCACERHGMWGRLPARRMSQAGTAGSPAS
jgi:hypothetical protein